MQHTGPAKPIGPRYLGKPRGMQKGVRVLPGAAMLSKETSEHEATDSKGTGVREGISEDQLDHTARTPTKFLEEIELCNREKRTRSATSIQVEGQGGSIMEHTTQETVERTIFSEVHEKRYTLAGEAPICNGELFQDLGYQANTKSS